MYRQIVIKIMANWCTTTYKVIGDKKQLNELYSKLNNIPHNKTCEYGDFSIDDFFSSLDYNTNGKSYRGGGCVLELNKNVLSFYITSAYRRCDEIFESINDKYRGLSVYYFELEGGMCVYETNDNTGKFFGKYWFYDYVTSNEKFFNDEKKLLSYASRRMRTKINSIEHLKELVYSKYYSSHFEFHEVTIRDYHEKVTGGIIGLHELYMREALIHYFMQNIDVDKLNADLMDRLNKGESKLVLDIATGLERYKRDVKV